MDIFGLRPPGDFPSEEYRKVNYLFTTWPGVERGLALDQLRAGWNAVEFRFLAAACWDDDWRESLAAFGVNPRPDERLRQETVLFGFYVAAAAVVESFCYAVFATAALTQPNHFREIQRWDQHRAINYSGTSARLLARFPGERLPVSLKAALAVPECRQIAGIRNVLLHRSLPLRHLSLDADGESVGPSEWHVGIRGFEAVAINPDLTALPRLWLSRTLAFLFHDMVVFVLARKATESEVVSTAMSEEGSLRTQRVTAVDLAHGRIRLPVPTKAVFPPDRGVVRVVLRGTTLEASYDPRLGPDRQRSAVLSVGRDTLGGLVRADEILQVRSLADGSVELA